MCHSSNGCIPFPCVAHCEGCMKREAIFPPDFSCFGFKGAFDDVRSASPSSKVGDLLADVQVVDPIRNDFGDVLRECLVFVICDGDVDFFFGSHGQLVRF